MTKRKRSDSNVDSVDSDSDSDESTSNKRVQIGGSTSSSKGGLYTNKQRVLVVASRGITARYRHLLEDFKKLMPHHKKDNKLDSKGDIQMINEIAGNLRFRFCVHIRNIFVS